MDQHLCDLVLLNTWVQAIVAILISIIIAFQHDIEIMKIKFTFWILLIITLSLLLTDNNIGLVYLMMAMTLISFNMSLNNSSAH